MYLTFYSLLICLVNYLSEGLRRIKCKFKHDHKKCKTCGNRYRYCDCFLEYANFKGELIEYKWLFWYKNYQHKFDEKLKKRCFNTNEDSGNENNRFISLLREGVYPYE